MKARFTLPLFVALVIALALPAQAQVDYDQLADINDLTNGGTIGDVEIDCMDTYFPEFAVGVEDPWFIFYNSASQNLMGYDPNDTAQGGGAFIIESAADLDISIGARARCRAMAVTETGTIYMAIETIPVAASGGELTMIYQSDVFSGGGLSGGGGSVIAQADGTTGIDVDPCINQPAQGICDTIFLAVSNFQSDIGMLEDGFYVLAEPVEAGGPLPLAPVEIYTDADLDLLDLHFDVIDTPNLGGGGDSFLVSVSSEFAGAKSPYVNVAVALNLQGGGGTVEGDQLEVIWEPCDDGTFSDCFDGGIEDIESFRICPPGSSGFCNPTAYVYNNSFDATDGEQWGAAISGPPPPPAVGGPLGIRFAEQTPMLADPDVTIAAYTGTIGTSMSALSDGTIYVASTTFAGGEDAIIAMRGAPVPVELVSFNAVVDGETVTLNWETASETNNAGFEVQTLRGETWDVLGWVEGHGTTTEAQQYSFSSDMLPGTYSFRLKQIDFDGQFEYFGGVEATVGTPSTHLLSSVYPNPFNPQATFNLAVAQSQNVSVELYSLLGRRVATLFDARMQADATQTFTIDGADLATGHYVVRVTGERFAESRRVTLLK